METPNVSIFCQKDLLSSYISTFEDMRGRGELIDFKITVQNRSFRGHRLILAAGIPYFRKFFDSSESEMFIGEMDPDVLESVISFAYSGKIEITDENVRSLISASKFFQLAQVHHACWEFLEKSLNLYNVMEIRNLAEKYNCFKLVDTSDHYIRSNFEAFSDSTSLLTLEFAFLKEVIGRDDVNVSTEEKVFEAVIRWVQDSPSERKSLFPELLTAVRLPLLTSDYLIERVCSEELVTSSRDCMKLVDEVKNYHLSTKKRSQLASFVTRPRRYAKSQYATCEDDTCESIYALCCSPSTTSVKLLDSRNGKWITLSTTHDDYQDIIDVIAAGGKIYIFLWTAIKVFDLKTFAWETGDKMHVQLTSFETTLYKNKIYFFGYDYHGSGKILCFDTVVNKWLKEEEMTKNCRFPGVSSLEGYIYITGGLIDRVISRDVERYDPELKKWTAMASMISPRCRHACCTLNGKVYVCGGGHFYDDDLSSAEVYDPLTNEWNAICSLKTPRLNFSLVPYNGKLYALGKQSTKRGRADIEIYDPKYNEWKFGSTVSDDDRCQVYLVSSEVPSGSQKGRWDCKLKKKM